jgi:hypothetical protein
MIELTLAQAFEKKFRLEIFGENDSRAYFEHDALILQIKNLLLAHPFLLKVLSEKNYSISTILAMINDYFRKIVKDRLIQENKLQQFVMINQKYRINETLALLLMMGFSFKYAFTRITNNQKKAGDKFIFENCDDMDLRVMDYEYILPKQEKNNIIIEFYKLIENVDVPFFVIEDSLSNYLSKVKNIHGSSKNKNKNKNKNN